MSRFRSGLLALLLLLLVAFATGCESTPQETQAAPPPDQTIDTELALATFDEAWRLVRDTHFDPEFNGVDWDAVRDELRPRLEETTSLRETRMVISEMLGRLGQSHFALIPGEAVDAKPAEDLWSGETEASETPAASAAAPTSGSETTTSPSPAVDEPAVETGPGWAGLQLRPVEGRLTVTSVAADSPAEAAGVRPGWIVKSVEGFDPAASVEGMASAAGESMAWLQVSMAAMQRFDADRGRTVRAVFLDEDDREVRVELVTAALPGTPVQFGNLPVMYVDFDAYEAPAEDARIGVIAFNFWMIPVVRPFREAVDEFRDADGIIIDLRGNLGGIGGMVMGIGGYFIDEKISLGTFKTRDATAEFRVQPQLLTADNKRTTPYAGPVAILIDGLSASTSEVFAGGMQGVGRVRVFGTTSAGAALPAMMDRLPNGDVLLHAMADFLAPSGQSLEGRGVVPDEVVETTREDLLQGRDPQMEAAIRWIQSGGAISAEGIGG